jgi:predicted Zn-dependent protease
MNATRYNRRQILGLGLGLGALAGCAVNPVTGERQLMLIDRGSEINLDREQSPHQFSADFGRVQDPQLNDYIGRVGLELARISDRPDMPYSFRAVNASHLNAYAFPGGSIAVTRGMLVELDNEAELAALLGHEIVHVAARHTAQRMTQQSLSNLVLTGVGQVVAQQSPDYAGLARDLGGLAQGALLARYSREDERQSDRLGLDYMVEAGHNPEGMVGLMEVLRGQRRNQPGVLEQMFATHPMGEERYRTAVEAVQQYSASVRNRPLHRERFREATASVRAIRGAIEKLQAANAALAGEKPAEAERLAREAVRAAPEDYAAHVVLGTALLSREQLQPALKQLRTAMELYPDEARAHHLAGVTLLQMDQPDAALERFQHYQQVLPGNPAMTFMIGYCHEQLGNRQPAAEHYYQYLQSVQQGPQAEHARQRLVAWGVLQSR